MRGPVVAGALVVLLLAGCGGGSDEPVTAARQAPVPESSTPVPEPTPQALVFAPGAKREQASGAIAVVDLRNRVGIEPAGMSVNREQTLSNLRWRGWGRSRTTAAGDVETLVCEPTCAQGRLEHSRATLTLSAPKRCDGGRFYSKASMTYAEEKTGKTDAPAAYLRAPC